MILARHALVAVLALAALLGATGCEADPAGTAGLAQSELDTGYAAITPSALLENVLGFALLFALTGACAPARSGRGRVSISTFLAGGYATW